MEKIKRTLGFILNHPLGRKHHLRCITRFLFWQLQIRVKPSKLIIKRFIGPVKFYARKGLTGITGNIYTGLHEFNDMGFLLHFLRPDDVFFDVGANVGSYTLLASGMCDAKTVALEPATTTLVLLNKNIFLNRLQNKVIIINAAAGAKKDVLRFSKNEDTTNHIIIENGAPNTFNEKVKVVSIDSLAVQDKPLLMKIDVEGFETEVLRGMSDTLKEPGLKAIIIELNGSGARYGFDENNIHLLLVANNFKPFEYNPFNRNLEPMESYGKQNTIYCRDVEFVNDRLKLADSFNIMGVKI